VSVVVGLLGIVDPTLDFVVLISLFHGFPVVVVCPVGEHLGIAD